MKNSVSPLPRKGMFDLQGYKQKRSTLPTISSTKHRSTTPEFPSMILSSTNELSSIFNKTGDFRSPKPSDRHILPLDLHSIKSLIKPLSLESFPIAHDSKLASNRQLLISLEKWFFEAKSMYSNEILTIIDLALQELVKEISLQCSNRARLVVLIFNSFKDLMEESIRVQVEEGKNKENIIKVWANDKIDQLCQETEFLKRSMDKYIEKSIRADDRNTLLSRENDVLKQIIVRFQMQFKLEPINFSKICELIIEDLADSSKRTQKKIVNTVAPKCYRNEKVQTNETFSVQFYEKTVQVSPLLKDKENQFSPTIASALTQTRPIKKPRLGIFKQGSTFIQSKSKSFNIASRLMRKKTKIFDLKDDLLPFSVHVDSKENQLILPKESLDKSIFEIDTDRKSIKFQDSLQDSHFSTRSLRELGRTQEFSKEATCRAITPHPNNKKNYMHRKQVNYIFNQKSKEVLNSCIKVGAKDLIFEATLSLRSLLKTIESMFFSCIARVRLNNFKGFLQHVYGRLSSKYSLRRIKQRRLRDLIASSVRYKDNLMPKLFLRALGAGAIIGQSNYSISTFKIILQVLSYFKAHLFGSPLVSFHGRKMCSKSKVLEFIKEVFYKRLDPVDYHRAIQQVEYHSEIDPLSNKGAMIEIEWIINYTIFTFDLYEKQVINGLKQVTDAITLTNSLIFPTKSEFLIAVQAFYPDSSLILHDQNNWRVFPFLHPSVSNKSLISLELLERFCLFRGLFKAKHVKLFKKDKVPEFDSRIIEEIQLRLDGISDDLLVNTLDKDDWIKKLELLKDYKDAGFAFAILSKELENILGFAFK